MKQHDSVKKAFNLREEQTCFMISPIGKEGTEVYEKFKNVLDYVIKPAVKNSKYKLKVIRADYVERSGSFIKDILELLLNSFIVIADLTDQNPNVFYELGVRHALSARTILIAQDVEFIPSDLREYRTIVYDDSAKGVAVFQERLTKFLEEIYSQPNRNDNPVLDRIGSLIETKTSRLENHIGELQDKLNTILKGGKKEKREGYPEDVYTRIERIFEIINADRSYNGTVIFNVEEGEDIEVELPPEQGKFELYFVLNDDKDEILEYWYLAEIPGVVNIDRLLADIRVILQKLTKIKKFEGETVKFIIVSNDDLSSLRVIARKKFQKMRKFVPTKQKLAINLEIWDKKRLLSKEKELGIIIDI